MAGQLHERPEDLLAEDDDQGSDDDQNQELDGAWGVVISPNNGAATDDGDDDAQSDQQICHGLRLSLDQVLAQLTIDPSQHRPIHYNLLVVSLASFVDSSPQGPNKSDEENSEENSQPRQ